jgi:carbonic anhydrase
MTCGSSRRFRLGCQSLLRPPAPSRRQVLAAMATVVAAMDGGVVLGQSTLSPEAALAQLLDGNARFRSGTIKSFEQDLTILKQRTVAKQEPFAAVLSCADSRVPVELVFDQTIGHIFVTRVAGNICTPEIIASLEYGAAVLGVPIFMVLGHDNCGAVSASIERKAVPGQISALYAPIQAAVQRGGPELTATIKANAQIQAELLRTASPVIAARVREGKVKVVAAYYDLQSGSVSLLD